MPDRDLPHLFLPGRAGAYAYTSHAQGGGGKKLPEIDRTSHGERLRQSFDREVRRGLQRREEVASEVEGPSEGIYLTFESFPDLELALESLENRRLRRPPELVAVRTEYREERAVQLATVFVPDQAIGHFLRKMEEYLTGETAKGAPRNQNLIERISDIRLATLEQLWTEQSQPFPPADEIVWWEVWLRRDEGREVARFLAFAADIEADVGRRRLSFRDRTVLLVRASANQLSESVVVLDDVAELREARAPSDFFAGLPPTEQADWIDDLLRRTTFAANPDAPRVCVLDTGVRRNHPLLQPALAPGDTHAMDQAWGSADDQGHGTEMSGLALFGNSLAALLGSNDHVVLEHALESVKILPRPPRQNPPDLYGAITADAIARVEIQAPHRRRAFSMAVTAEISGLETLGGSGDPTSWSAAVDALAVGRSFVERPRGLAYLDADEVDQGRLIVVAAGNIRRGRWDEEHLNRSDLEPIEDPGQAWNALTVGAFTELYDPGPFEESRPVAPRGELSPFSRTSVMFPARWPSKPEVLFEGGNLAVSPTGGFDTPERMQLLTSHGGAGTRLLTVSNATSAATAQAARMAAQVWATYPDLWPETLRALIVHGARWTPAMQAHFDAASSRTATKALYRRYGMGVPTLDRVLRSAANDVVLVAENTIRPFEDGKMREMHLHDLPWPREQLEDLGETRVGLRVTLSYFIEPNPSRRGWVGRFRYASHGLRFDVKRPTESPERFHKRMNKEALAEEEKKPKGGSDASEWLLGPIERHGGSIHSDIWSGTAADLAARGAIAVYPVSGWWKDIKGADRSEEGVRYALIVSVEAPAVEVDLWTPISAQIGVLIVPEI